MLLSVDDNLFSPASSLQKTRVVYIIHLFILLARHYLEFRLCHPSLDSSNTVPLVLELNFVSSYSSLNSFQITYLNKNYLQVVNVPKCFWTLDKAVSP